MKKIITIIMMLASFNIFANEVYIEQVGNNSTVTITQDGAGNKIGTNITPFYIGSGSNTVTIDQIGSTNTLTGVINGSATDLTLSTTGSNNIQEVNCGSTATASCSSSTITQTIVGDDNTITQNLGTGANHSSNINVTGDFNAVTHTSTMTGASTVDITVIGNTNTIGVTQSGLLPKTVSVTSTGNNNTVSITQSD
jgi:Curlin associated repeat